MECDVCGRSMWRWPLDSNPWVEETWSCSWCYAVTMVDVGRFELCRPPYAPADKRWERADGEGLPPGSVHAFGSFEKTLCGIEFPGLSPSDYFWFPERRDACGECWAAAVTIDERWPRELRGAHARTGIARQLSNPGAGNREGARLERPD